MNNQLLFIGPFLKNPKGGVAFVLNEYKKLFPESYFVASTKGGNNFNKLIGFIIGLFHFIFLMVRRHSVKIVHIHGASYNSFKRKYIFFLIAKLFNKKVIYHIHGGAFHNFYSNVPNKFKKKIQRFVNDSDAIVCLSNHWKVFFSNNFNQKNIIIIPNIIPQPEIIPSQKAIKQIKEFLFLGLIDENKGVWLLLETLKDHKHEIEQNAIFRIGGNGETIKLQKLIIEYGLSNFVEFLGWVSGTEKQNLLTSADVYLLPSYNEGMPISILEAMSYSLPILSTNVGGIPEIVSIDNGIIIEPGNKEQLWKAIESFIKADSSRLYEMGKHSYQKIQMYLPDNVKMHLISLYRSL